MAAQTTISPNTLGVKKPDNPFQTAPPPLRRARSLAQVQNKLRQTRSPTRRQISDDIFADLTPDGILDLFANASSDHEASIEAAGPELRELGKRAAVASGYIHEWYNEIKAWPWPEKVNGFLPPTGKNDAEYYGSLAKSDIFSYKERLHEIRDGLDYLDVREIHQRVREFNCMTGGNNSPTSPTAPTNHRFSSASIHAPKIINKFEILITHTTVEALPKLGQLESAILDWQNRVSILEQVPATLSALDAAERALQNAYAETNYDRQTYNTTKVHLDLLCKEGGRLIDFMLTFVERGEDKLPSAWIDRIDAIEEDYQNWCVQFKAKVLANEKIERDLEEARLRQLEKDEAAALQQVAFDECGAEDVTDQLDGPFGPANEVSSKYPVEDPIKQAEAVTRGWGECPAPVASEAPAAAATKSPECEAKSTKVNDRSAGTVSTVIELNSKSESGVVETAAAPFVEETRLNDDFAQLSLDEQDQSALNPEPTKAELVVSSDVESPHPVVFITDANKDWVDTSTPITQKPAYFDNEISNSQDENIALPSVDVDELARPVSSDTFVSFSSNDNGSERGHIFGAAFDADFDFRSPQSPGLKGLKSPSRIPRATISKAIESQLYRQVSGIVSALPGRVTLRRGAVAKSSEPSPPKTPVTAKAPAARPNLKRQASRSTLSTAPRPSPFSRPPSPSFTRGSRRDSVPGLGLPGTPGRESTPVPTSPAIISTGLDLTLVPLDPRHPNYRHDNISGHIHIARGDGRPPLVIYVTLAGSGSNVVQVRVGGGYQELSKFLTDYQAHHGTRVKLGEVEDFVIMPLDRNSGSTIRGAATFSPVSRPGTALGGPKILATPMLGGSLRVGKRGTRRSVSGSNVFGGNLRERTLRIPTSPLPQMVSMLNDGPENQQVPTLRSTSLHAAPSLSQGARIGPLGPAFVMSPTSQHTPKTTPPEQSGPGSPAARNALQSVEKPSKRLADRSSQLKRESWVQNVYDVVSKSVQKSTSTPSKAMEGGKDSAQKSLSIAKRPAWGSNRKPADLKTKRENEEATLNKASGGKKLTKPTTPRTKRNQSTIKGGAVSRLGPRLAQEISNSTGENLGTTKHIRRVSSEPKFMYSSRSASSNHTPSLVSEGSVASFESIKEEVKE